MAMARAEEEKTPTMQDVVRGEAAAEAGPGAADTNAPPLNELKEGEEKANADRPGSDASTASPNAKPVDQKDTVKPFEERGRGKIAVIMTALGVCPAQNILLRLPPGCAQSRACANLCP